MRDLKKLGMALTVIFAMGMVGGSSASAEFHTSVAPVAITGTQTTSMVITTNSGTITCKVVTYSGTQTTSTSSTLKVTPEYKTCTAFGFISVPVHINGCSHRLDSNGTSQLECPAGKAIEVTAPFCTTTFGPQHFASGLTYTTAGTTPNRYVIAHKNISGVHYVEDCPSTTRTNGTWKETVAFKPGSGEMWPH